MDKQQEAEIREALEASKTAYIAERDAAAQRLHAEANVREAFGDQTGADNLREVVDYGQQLTDRYRNS
jgi:hypothetical protein